MQPTMYHFDEDVSVDQLRGYSLDTDATFIPLRDVNFAPRFHELFYGSVSFVQKRNT